MIILSSRSLTSQGEVLVFEVNTSNSIIEFVWMFTQEVSSPLDPMEAD